MSSPRLVELKELVLRELGLTPEGELAEGAVLSAISPPRIEPMPDELAIR
jgi:hypothetical protein